MISEKQKGLISFLAVHVFLLTQDPLSNDQDQSSASMNGLRNPEHSDVQVEGSDNSMGGWYSISTQHGMWDDVCVEFQGSYWEREMRKIASAACRALCFKHPMWTGDKGGYGGAWRAATIENKRCVDRSKGTSWDQDELVKCWPAGTTFWMRNDDDDKGIYTYKAGTSKGQVCLYD